MPNFQGRLEVARLRQRLQDTFSRVDQIDGAALELRSDMARYLCVLVCGYVEKSFQELAIQWCRGQSSPSVLMYASRGLKRTQNLNGKRFKQSLEAFDPAWRTAIEDTFGQEVDALNSIYGNRNQIAHGANVGLTIIQIKAYYDQVERLVDFMVEKMDPAP